jgi:hypothetical protein
MQMALVWLQVISTSSGEVGRLKCEALTVN